MERRLGRGLGSLLSQEPVREERPTEVPVSQIRPNPFQPREVFSAEGLEELTDSVRSHGVLQPIAVRKAAEGFEIISGERRWRAAKAAGLRTIPVALRDEVSDGEMLELALVENLQRVDLDPIERAHGFQRLMEADLTQEAVASRVGLKRSTVANHLRLLELPDSVQRMVGEGLLAMGHARALLGVKDKKGCERLAATVARKDLSVRETEKLVREAGRSRAGRTGAAPKDAPEVQPWAREMQDRIRERLGTKVEVRNGPGYRGQIVIEYYSREDLERIYAALAPNEGL